MSDTTTGGGLKPGNGSGKVGVLARIGNALSGKRPAGDPIRDPDGLKTLIRADRIRRRLTWPDYAKFLGVSASTLHKIATGVHKASELTEATIRDAIDASPVRKKR